MAFDRLGWFQGKKKEKEAAERLLMEELQGLKKLLRKQSVLIEEVRREQEAAAEKDRRSPEALLELCDAIFYLQRAFQSPGIMSRQHAQVLNMVLVKVERFAASLGLEIVVQEGVAFDPDIHEAVANRSPGSPILEVLEVVQPGYMQGAKVLRPAKVVLGAAEAPSLSSRGRSKS